MSWFADEHNVLLKSTRRNINLNKFALEPHDYQIYYVNIDFLCAKHSQKRRARRNGCFCRLAVYQLNKKQQQQVNS